MNILKKVIQIEFIKYAKENGYITGHIYEHCSHVLYNDEKNTDSKNVKSYFWDHENIVIFCDPNYYIKNLLLLIIEVLVLV